MLYTRDRVETTSKVWMGLTAGCAVCHDHKFDPLTQKEFYELAAFFNNTTQSPMDGNIKDTPPIVIVPQEADAKRWDEVAKEIPAAKELVDDRRGDARPDFDTWLATRQAGGCRGRDADVRPRTVRAARRRRRNGPLRTARRKRGKAAAEDGRMAARSRRLEGRVSESGRRARRRRRPATSTRTRRSRIAAWVKLPANDGSGAIIARMKDDADFRGWDMWVEGRRVGTHIVNKWPENAIKVVTQGSIAGRPMGARRRYV